MTTQTQTLVAFLLARIAEDEEPAQRAATGYSGRARWMVSPDLGVGDHSGEVVIYSHSVTSLAVGHIARHDPARVLAECEAKRRIVEEHRLLDPAFADVVAVCATCEDRYKHDAADWPCRTLRILAAVYSDHPDYRQEWAV